MPNPTWFNEDYFLTQKAAQMNAINWNGKSNWTAAEAGQQIAAFRTTAFDNFTACNTSGYQGISAAQLNVAPNELFNVAQYVYNSSQLANMSMDAALNAMVNTHHTSAWAHYTAMWDTEWLNPSNLFDTRAYVEDVAQAWNSSSYQGKTDWNVSNVAAAIKSAGMNPVMHYYEVGQSLGITPTVPTTLANPAASWTPWSTGGSAPADQPDPYDSVQTQVDITTDQDVYPAEGQSYSGNTQFNAIWTGAYGASTLAANDIITGPAGKLNTLAVELGKSWTGFNTKSDDDYNPIPNVTNVGRIKLDHITSDTEASYTFDASGVSADTVQYDLNSTGAGTISLINLNKAVQTVNVRDVTIPNAGAAAGDAPHLLLEWTEALSGKNDALNIGVRNLGAEGTGVQIDADGIENVTLNSEAGDQTNYVDLSQMTGVKNLTITGSNDITMTGAAPGIATFDASQATGAVNVYAADLTSKTVVKGGSNIDTLTMATAENITPTQWTGIETLTMLAGGTVNAKNVEPVLNSLWVGGATTNTITHLTASDFTVNQGWTGETTVRVDGNQGSLVNITYAHGASGAAGAKADFSSNATGNATINVGPALLASGSEFKFAKAEGAVTLKVAEDGWFGTDKDTTPIKIAARDASSFTADVEGTFNYAEDEFEVINGKQGGGVLTFNLATGMTNSAGKLAATDGIVITAKAATELNVTSGGDFFIKDTSKLDGIQVATIAMSGESNDAAEDGAAFLYKGTLAAAQKVSVTSEGGDVTLGELGSDKGKADLTVNIEGAQDVEVGPMKASLGHNITANISAEGMVKLGDITTTTNTKVNGQGDVKLTVSANGLEAGKVNITGDDLVIDLGDVENNGLNSDSTLTAVGSIRYTGANGADTIVVAQVGGSQRSVFDMGAGDDFLTINADSVASKASLRMNVSLGEGDDTLTVNAQTASKAHLIVNVSDFGEGADTLTFSAAAITTVKEAQALTKAFGISFGSAQAFASGTKVGDTTVTADGLYMNGNAYLFSDATQDATTMVVLQGVDIADTALTDLA